jgi:P-type Ca2+ transporter type 2C
VDEPHTRTSSAVLTALAASAQDGLGEAEVERRARLWGPNRLRELPPPGILSMFRRQFDDFLIWLLIVAAAISAVIGHVEGAGYAEALAIIAIVILNAVIGVFQEHRAEHAMRALQAMAAPEATVIREGHRRSIPAAEVVVGDIVVLETGNYVPADLRLVEAVNLQLDEAALTGEGVPVLKQADDLFAADAPLGDRRNLAFGGTVVTYGRGSGVATAIGMDTEIGRIAELLQSYEHEPTPLQVRLAELGRTLGLITLAICGIVFAVGLIRDTSLPLLLRAPAAYLAAYGQVVLDLFMVAVALAIAAVPEGLPAVVTVALAIGMQRMVRRHALIRRLPAVETLGSATVICSDKTGTLTQNEMVVVQAELEGRTLAVRGEGYAPLGEITLDGQPISHAVDDDLHLLAAAATLASDAIVEREGDGWRLVGDPTEGALVAFAARAGLDRADLADRLPRVAEIPFDGARKRMTTIHRVTGPDGFQVANAAPGTLIAFVKGAPDVVVSLASHYQSYGRSVELDDEMRDRIRERNREMAQRALRVLGVAYRRVDAAEVEGGAAVIEQGLTLIGLVGIIDPPRPEASSAVAVARRAGIRTMMVTGDYADTALAIARAIGLMRPQGQVVTSTELEAMDDAALAARIQDIDVVARVSPQHKVRIVDALKSAGEVVAMTGDGVNDAPALKRAHIGVAMGITGTDVSREAADMVLTDDNFASIVAAIEEGRTIYDNIRKFVFYLLSCNIGEILIIFTAMLAGLTGDSGQAPLQPIQLLWLNLVTDGLPALALGMEAAEPDVMRRPPRDPAEPVLSRDLWPLIGVQAVVDAIATLGALVWALRTSGDLRFAQTVAFSTLVTAELLRAFTSRSQYRSIFQMGVFTNRWLVLATATSFALLWIVLYIPALSTAFQTVPLAAADWLRVLAFALLPASAAELTKAWVRRHRPADGRPASGQTIRAASGDLVS